MNAPRPAYAGSYTTTTGDSEDVAGGVLELVADGDVSNPPSEVSQDITDAEIRVMRKTVSYLDPAALSTTPTFLTNGLITLRPGMVYMLGLGREKRASHRIAMSEVVRRSHMGATIAHGAGVNVLDMPSLRNARAYVDGEVLTYSAALHEPAGPASDYALVHTVNGVLKMPVYSQTKSTEKVHAHVPPYPMKYSLAFSKDIAKDRNGKDVAPKRLVVTNHFLDQGGSGMLTENEFTGLVTDYASAKGKVNYMIQNSHNYNGKPRDPEGYVAIIIKTQGNNRIVFSVKGMMTGDPYSENGAILTASLVLAITYMENGGVPKLITGTRRFVGGAPFVAGGNAYVNSTVRSHDMFSALPLAMVSSENKAELISTGYTVLNGSGVEYADVAALSPEIIDLLVSDALKNISFEAGCDQEFAINTISKHISMISDGAGYMFVPDVRIQLARYALARYGAGVYGGPGSFMLAREPSYSQIIHHLYPICIKAGSYVCCVPSLQVLRLLAHFPDSTRTAFSRGRASIVFKQKNTSELLVTRYPIPYGGTLLTRPSSDVSGPHVSSYDGAAMSFGAMVRELEIKARSELTYPSSKLTYNWKGSRFCALCVVTPAFFVIVECLEGGTTTAAAGPNPKFSSMIKFSKNELREIDGVYMPEAILAVRGSSYAESYVQSLRGTP